MAVVKSAVRNPKKNSLEKTGSLYNQSLRQLKEWWKLALLLTALSFVDSGELQGKSLQMCNAIQIHLH
jgi:hypothetical protein